MTGFGLYPPNLASKNAVVLREEAPASHAVDAYAADNILAKSETAGVKRKTVPAGHAEETFVSEHTFRSKHRAIERGGGPERTYQSRDEIRQASARIRSGREPKGDATVVEGNEAYVGPWAKYNRRPQAEALAEGEQIGSSDEEYEIVDEEEEEEEEEGGDDVVQSGTVIKAPASAMARREEVAALGAETTTLHGPESDYLGRTYMHVPQDLDVDLRKEVGTVTNFIPKKTVFVWRTKAQQQHHHQKHQKQQQHQPQQQQQQAVTALRFLPQSGHLLLSASADSAVRIWDVYHQRELLRTYQGHSKSVADVTFNESGTQFLSASFDRMIKLWDTETGAVVNRFSTGKTPHVVKFNPAVEAGGCELLAGMSDNKIVQWDARTGGGGGDPVQTYDHHLAPINTIEFHDRDRRFATTSDDRTIRCWEVNIPVPVKYVAEIDMFPLTRSARHPNGKSIAYQSSDNQIVVYGATEKFPLNRKKAYRGHNNAGTGIDVAVSPDGQFIASGDTAGFVYFWDWKTCKLFSKLKAGDQPITCVQWHPQETSKLVTAGLDGRIRYWD